VMWFGESWGAPVCEPEQHTTTPVDHVCVECDKLIESGDTGFVMQSNAYHRVCFLRTVIPCEMWNAELKTDMPDRWRQHWDERHSMT
jgi:hypothetical protein